MVESGAGAAVARMWCRVAGHKWALMPGISHGHDELYECRRCGQYDWRDLPAADAVEVETRADTQAQEGSPRVRTRGRPAAAPGPARRR